MKPKKIEFPTDLEKVIGDYRVRISGAKGVATFASNYRICGDIYVARLGQPVEKRRFLPPFKKYNERKPEWELYARVCFDSEDIARDINMEFAEKEGVTVDESELRDIIEPLMEPYRNAMNHVNQSSNSVRLLNEGLEETF